MVGLSPSLLCTTYLVNKGWSALSCKIDNSRGEARDRRRSKIRVDCWRVLGLACAVFPLLYTGVVIIRILRSSGHNCHHNKFSVQPTTSPLFHHHFTQNETATIPFLPVSAVVSFTPQIYHCMKLQMKWNAHTRVEHTSTTISVRNN